MAKCFPFFESSLADERQWTQVVRMDFIDHSPFKQIVATLLLLLGMSSALRGLRFLIFAIRKPEHPSGPLRVVRGLRGLIVALAFTADGRRLVSAAEDRAVKILPVREH